MPEKNRRLIYSTEPEPEQTEAEQPKAKAAEKGALPANPAGPVPSRQGNQPVIVGIERKGRGGKTVSVLTGVMSSAAGKEALLKLLKTKLGAGGALKDDGIEIQGDHRDQIVTILNGLGYKAKKSGG